MDRPTPVPPEPAAAAEDPASGRVGLTRRAPSVPTADPAPAAGGDEVPTADDAALPPRERPVEPANALAVVSLTLGGLAVALGVTLVWFFLALPFGLIAVACALAERRRTKHRTGRRAGGIVTAGLVLGLASIPIALGGLVVIPRAQDFVGESVRDANGVVAEDLDSLERSFRRNVDALDRTLSENVDQSTQSLSEDFSQLESSSQAELDEAVQALRQIISELERTTQADLTQLEESVSADIEEERRIIAQIDGELRTALGDSRAEVERLKARVEALEG